MLVQTKKTEDQYFSVIQPCKEIFLKKTRDYGTSWSILRMPSITDQIYIKAERIRTLEEKKITKVGENIEGEFQGIVNYCVMAMLLQNLKDKGITVFPDEMKDVNELEKIYTEKVQETFDLMMRKNHDYGEAWRNMRVSSFTDLILMKILRLKEIENNDGNTLISEGPIANYMDILNYAVFALIKLTLENDAN